MVLSPPMRRLVHLLAAVVVAAGLEVVRTARLIAEVVVVAQAARGRVLRLGVPRRGRIRRGRLLRTLRLHVAEARAALVLRLVRRVVGVRAGAEVDNLWVDVEVRVGGGGG